MRFTLLGPLEIVTSEGALTPSAPMLRRVLALLLLRADTVVRSGALVEELWGDRPPRSARTTLQTYIYQLRKLFGTFESDHDPGDSLALLTKPPGYELQLGKGDQVDVYEFEALVNRAKACRHEGLIEDAVAALNEALSLWSGAALTDVERGPLLDAEATRLEEIRKEVLELRLELDLQLGRHHEVVSELLSLVSANPVHEGFVAKLMLALVRCGRRAEALDVYQRTRAELVARLGLEPSIEIQQLHHSILKGDGEVGARVPAAPGMSLLSPAQLPPSITDFVGRTAETGRLRSAVAGDCGLSIVQVLGPPGVGKTAFVLQAAHELRSLFPDGQFYANVGDLSDCGRGLSDILAGFLCSCGIPPDRLPTGLRELSNMFRTWTADRKVLVVLDEVLAARHIRELAPGGSSCAMLVVSRTRPTAMPGMVTISLGPLPEDSALELLGRLIGPERVATEPEAARALIRTCDRLPLALRAVAGRIAARPHWGLDRMIGRLSRSDNLLVELGEHGDELLASVEASRRQLGGITRDALDLIAGLCVETVTAPVVADLLDIRVAAAETLLEQLVDASLIEEQPSIQEGQESSYRFPTLFQAAVRQLIEPWHASLVGPVSPSTSRPREPADA
ncbi:BTAD domain-containing putative transcriptional regulator [Microtetraspora malaysiensis]|uniref:AfsR/SARP family transcriptional regulator n=1 Tax=Microtetraspora malaysiensis TaxID=161358 RepID=UPI003D8D589C